MINTFAYPALIAARVRETSGGGSTPPTHITTTLTHPGYVWVAGLDRSDEVTVSLGQVETPMVTATLRADAIATQTLTSTDGRLSVAFPPGAITPGRWW